MNDKGKFLFQDAKVYCGTYGKYNDGSLYGEWIRLDDYSTFEDFMEYIRELHKDEEDPEFMFQDVEDFFIDEEPSLSDIKVWYELFKYDLYPYYLDEDIAKEIVRQFADKWENLKEYCENHYYCSFDSFYDLGFSSSKDLGLPDSLDYYFDFEKYGKAIAEEYDVVEGDGEKILLFC